jgi:hypothetical protein
MQRVLVIVALVLLVVASLGVGALTAHWPFWRRAWAWHVAGAGWPSGLPGPVTNVRGNGKPLQFSPAGADLVQLAEGARTHLLLRVRGGMADAWFGDGYDAASRIDGRGLAVLVLAPLFEELEQVHTGVLDQPVGAWISEWRQDERGNLTPRELLRQVEGGIAMPAGFTPLNPFSARAQLASGPDFHQAALATLPPTAARANAHQAAAAQLLAQVAAAVGARGFAAVLEQHLWSALAAEDATLVLDRRRGAAAAHCCIEAAASDWLRLGVRLGASAGAGVGPVRVAATQGRMLLSAPAGAALLWVGDGAPPSGLEKALAVPENL